MRPFGSIIVVKSMFAFVVERPDAEQLVVSESRVFHAVVGAVAAAAMIYMLFGDSTFGAGALLLVIPLWYIARFLYIGFAGQSFCFDSSKGLIFKNGQRLTSFAGVKSVFVALRYRPSVNLFLSKYTLFLRLKSGEEVAIAAVTVEAFWQYLLRQFKDKREVILDEDDQELHQLADEIGAMLGVEVTKER